MTITKVISFIGSILKCFTKSLLLSGNCIIATVLDNADNIRNNYLGFVVLRPLRYCIGRNVIDPKAKDDTSLQQAKICRATIESSCFGIKLNAVGFPHSSQDTETMTCAQTTIWALLEYYGNKYNI